MPLRPVQPCGVLTPYLAALRRQIAILCADLDIRTVVVPITVAAMLTWLEFRSNAYTFQTWFASSQWWGATNALEYNLHAWAWWALNCFGTMFLVPALFVVLAFRLPLSEFGLKMPSPRTQIPLALAMYALVLPFVIMASRSPQFQQTYPLFTQAVFVPPGLVGPGGAVMSPYPLFAQDRDAVALLLMWEALYLTQFFALEFFFRGFMIFGLEKRFGSAAVLIACIPYCMVHFHKPMLEAYAAIIAGLVLGSVALRTRSLWSGFIVHALVAITMDCLALHAKGFF